MVRNYYTYNFCRLVSSNFSKDFVLSFRKFYFSEKKMSAHKFRILNLYKRVLKSHQALPVDLRHFGDVYVKSRGLFFGITRVLARILTENLSQSGEEMHFESSLSSEFTLELEELVKNPI